MVLAFHVDAPDPVARPARAAFPSVSSKDGSSRFRTVGRPIASTRPGQTLSKHFRSWLV